MLVFRHHDFLVRAESGESADEQPGNQCKVLKIPSADAESFTCLPSPYATIDFSIKPAIGPPQTRQIDFRCYAGLSYPSFRNPFFKWVGYQRGTREGMSYLSIPPLLHSFFGIRALALKTEICHLAR